MLKLRSKLRTGAAAMVLLLAGCATHNIVQAPNGRFQVKRGFNQYAPTDDVKLGQMASQQVQQQMPLLPEDSPVAQYVRNLGERLAEHAPRDVSWPFSFHVVNQKDINAFALPGGPVYVNLGTVQAADDEGELAGVIAHEIAHVVLRHSTEQASKAQLAQLPLAILGGVLPQGAVGQLAALGLSFGAQSVFMKYSRDAEREADLLGAQIMYDTGFNPYDMVEFFTKLEKQGGPGVPQFLSDHPNPGNRVTDVREAIQKFPKKLFHKDSPEFARVHSKAERMHAMDQKEIASWQRQHMPQGQMNTDGLSSGDGQYATLNHQAFQMSYPAGWKVYGNENSPVVIAPEGAVGQNSIAAGVMVSGYMPPQQEPIGYATNDLLRRITAQNPNLRVASQGQQISVRGMPAASVSLVGPSPVQGPQGPLVERDQLVTVQRSDGSILFLVFIAPEQEFQRFQPAFEQMLQSLRVG